MLHAYMHFVTSFKITYLMPKDDQYDWNTYRILMELMTFILADVNTYIFFFHWRYSPLWALARRTIPLHFSKSFTNCFHFLTLITWRSLPFFYLTLYTVLRDLEDALLLPKYISSPFPSIIIKSTHQYIYKFLINKDQQLSVTEHKV
jgi:hypothetical protein